MSNNEFEPGKATIVVGLQYGDEGKGKIVDLLAQDASAVARGNGGANAGHTIVANGQKATLHQVPSGIVHKDKMNIIGHGSLLDPVKLAEEVDELGRLGIKVTPENLAISGMAHLVTPKHKLLDAERESGDKAQGSTKSGIAFAAADASLREGVRFESVNCMSRSDLLNLAYRGLRGKDRESSLTLKTPVRAIEAFEQAKLFAETTERFKGHLADTTDLIHDILDRGDNVLVEGAQAYGLDKNHGKYPNCTSSGTIVPSLMEGTGLNHKQVGRVVGIAKATMSKVGGGSFVTREDDSEIAQAIRGKQGEIDAEFGGTTGREREVGHLDLVMLKRAIKVNGVDELALTKFDCIKRVGSITKLAIAYQIPVPGGRKGETKTIYKPPNSDEELAECKPVYRHMLTWEDNNSAEAQKYLKFVEEYIGIPVTIVSTGPGRNSIMRRSSAKS